MVDSVKLKKRIDDSGVSVSELSSKMSMAPSTFYRKLGNPDKFLICEVTFIVDYLKLSFSEANEIFFGISVA